MKRLDNEVKEAIKACDKVLILLEATRKSINTAQGLGVIDLLGGKTFTSFVKQTRISKAQKKLVKAKKAIEDLNNELKDVTQIVDIKFEMGFLLTLADYFFGGPIADWIILGRLGETKKNIEKAKFQVLELREELLKLY